MALSVRGELPERLRALDVWPEVGATVQGAAESQAAESQAESETRIQPVSPLS